MLDHLVNIAILGCGFLAVPPDVVHHHRRVIEKAVKSVVRRLRRQPEAATYDIEAHRERMLELQREFDELG